MGSDRGQNSLSKGKRKNKTENNLLLKIKRLKNLLREIRQNGMENFFENVRIIFFLIWVVMDGIFLERDGIGCLSVYTLLLFALRGGVMDKDPKDLCNDFHVLFP